jgi:hypothetical protein
VTAAGTNVPRIEAHCQGGPGEMGFAQGEALRTKIHATRECLCDLEAFRHTQPCCLPYLLFRWAAERKAHRLATPIFSTSAPRMARRLEAMAKGALMPLPALHLLNILEPFLCSVSKLVESPAACSALAVRGSRSATGEPMMARNFDYLPLVQPSFTLRECRPAQGWRSIEFIVAPMAGAVDGMNEKGLCIAYDYAFVADRPPKLGLPISMVVSEALERCGTVEEAIGWIDSRPRWGGALLMLADAQGDLASLEVSNTRTQARRPKPGEDSLFHTNKFWTPEMKGLEVPENAVFRDKAPPSLRGRRLHASAQSRDARLGALMAQGGPLDADGLQRIMADHGADVVPSSHTPCVHGDYWFTTASLQFFPKRRTMRVAYTTTCQARYTTFEV